MRKKVDIRYTKSSIEVYYKGNRICSHKRFYGRRRQYSTILEHMPVNYHLYSEWDKARFLKWASGIGESTLVALERIPSPRYKNIRLILESSNDKAASPSSQSSEMIHNESYSLVRGASYYGGGSHEK
ncbi:hypothetical protein NSB04_16990 [Blautia pseudococcoides]|nr:hypothetical protein [Blautia pseudococcoides]